MRLHREKKKAKRNATRDRHRQMLGINGTSSFAVSAEEDLFSLSAIAEISADKDLMLTVDPHETMEDISDVDDGYNDVVVGDDDLDVQLDHAYLSYMARKDQQVRHDSADLLPSQRMRKHALQPEIILESKKLDDDIKQYTSQDAESDPPVGMPSDITWYSHPIFDQCLVSTAENVGEKHDNSVMNSLNMPKTEKEIRKEKRKKLSDKKDRKNSRQDKLISEATITPHVIENPEIESISKRSEKYKELIQKGFGKVSPDDEENKVDVVKNSNLGLEVCDSRVYDSDSEIYDSRDRLMTLALGTLMLDKSRKKALIDASGYNRYSWNDTKDLPVWFTDDEARHNKPEVPVPNALLDQVMLSN